MDGCLRYLAAALNGELQGLDSSGSLALWNRFINGYQPILFHFFSMAIGTFILLRGVVRGIEKANRVSIPSLAVLLLILLSARSHPPRHLGRNRAVFHREVDLLLNHRVWLDGLT